MPVQTMQSIAEHSLFKAALPIICAALIGSITWIFVTVMDLDKVLHRVEQSEIPQINADLANGYKKIEELENEVEKIKNEDIYLKISSNENKTKHNKLVSQINYYEAEIKKINIHHDKIIWQGKINRQIIGALG